MFVTAKLLMSIHSGDIDLHIGGSLGGDWRFSPDFALRIEAANYARGVDALTVGIVIFL
jgi:hypothetical protein